MQAHHPPVRGRAGVEGNLRAHEGFFILIRDHKSGQLQRRAAFALTFGNALVDGGQQHFTQIARRVEGVHQEAVGHLARQPGQAGVDARDVNGNVGVLDGAGVEERRHEGEFVVFAAEVEALAMLPCVPEGAHGQNLLPQFAHHGIRPRHAKAAGDVRLDLRSQAEDEASIRGCGQIPRGVGQVGGAAGKGNGDRGAECHAAGVLGNQRTGQKGVVLGFRCPDGGKA